MSVRQLTTYLPSCSGSAGSALDAALLDFEGRRFLGSTLTAAQIAQLTNTAADSPIRVYAGLRHGATATARAEAACAELDALGAWERPWLLVGSPTGTGWVNHVALRSLEALTAGACSSVALQWGDARSIRSRGQVDAACDSLVQLLEALHRARRGNTTRILVYAESFGAWVASRVLATLQRTRPAALMLVGTPGIARIGSRAAALEGLQIAGTHVSHLANEDDPVARFPGPRALVLPAASGSRRWLPVLTAVRELRAIESVTQARPTTVPASRHDYRHEVTSLIAGALGMSPADPRAERARDALLELERRESTWFTTYGPAPHLAWPRIDTAEAVPAVSVLAGS